MKIIFLENISEDIIVIRLNVDLFGVKCLQFKEIALSRALKDIPNRFGAYIHMVRFLDCTACIIELNWTRYPRI